MGGMDGVSLEGLGAFKGGVQHQVGGGRGETVDVDMHFHKARNFARQTFQPFLDACLDGGFFGVGQLVLQLPQDHMLDHNKIPPAFFLIVTG